MPSKTSLRDKLDEEVLDLSLMQLNEVPVTEIVSIKEKYIDIFQDCKTVIEFAKHFSASDYT